MPVDDKDSNFAQGRRVLSFFRSYLSVGIYLLTEKLKANWSETFKTSESVSCSSFLPGKTVNCATSMLPLQQVRRDPFSKIYEDMIEKWYQHHINAPCHWNCGEKNNRARELEVRLTQLTKQAERLQLRYDHRNYPIKDPQLSRFRRKLSLMNEDRQDRLYRQPHHDDPHTPVRLTNIVNESRRHSLGGQPPVFVGHHGGAAGGKEAAEAVEAAEGNRRKSRHVVIQKQTPKKPMIHYARAKESPSMKSSMKKQTQRRVRRPSWLPKPNLK